MLKIFSPLDLLQKQIVRSPFWCSALDIPTHKKLSVPPRKLCYFLLNVLLNTNTHMQMIARINHKEHRGDDITKNLFLHFSILNTIDRLSMMKNLYSPNVVEIG